jgi:hypothetical protein
MIWLHMAAPIAYGRKWFDMANRIVPANGLGEAGEK